MTVREKEVKNLFARIGGALLLFLAAYNVLCGGTAEIGEILTTFNHSAGIYITASLLSSASYIAAFTIPAWFFYKISKNKNAQSAGLSFSFSENCSVVGTMAITFLGASLCFCFSYVNSILAPISQDASDLFFQADLDRGYKLILLFISTAIVPALVEEFLFRGVILSNISPYSEGGAILISALFFGLMHQTTFQLLYTTALGIVLGVLFVRTKSIWCGVILHFFNNFLSIVQEYMLYRYDNTEGYMLYYISILLTFLIGIILCAIWANENHRKKKDKTNDIGVFGKNVFYNKLAERAESRMIYKAFFAPTVMIYIVICVVTMVMTSIAINGTVWL